MIFVLCIPQYKSENFPLQPWLTINRIAKGFSDRGHNVQLITDVEQPDYRDKIRIHTVDSLRGTNSRQICRLLSKIRPDRVIVTITPLSLVTAGWYQVLKQYSSYGYISYPFYSNKQIIRAFPHLCWKDRWEYGRHLLIPRFAWAAKLIRFFNGVICQSEHTAKKIEYITNSKIRVQHIPAGIDMEAWELSDDRKAADDRSYFLYFGAASRIRGFFLLLKAFNMLADPDIKLRVLSRGADKSALTILKKEIEKYKIAQRVSVRGGWIDTGELKKQIRSAKAVLFPFILVPSEIPVSVLETIYCGTPVVVSDLVGLPEVAGNAGIVVKQADVRKMALAIQKLHREKEYHAKLSASCYEQRNAIISWDSACKKWNEFLTS
jgi:glycosyltransferase involved in cell wall biosynthesis